MALLQPRLWWAPWAETGARSWACHWRRHHQYQSTSWEQRDIGGNKDVQHALTHAHRGMRSNRGGDRVYRYHASLNAIAGSEGFVPAGLQSKGLKYLGRSGVVGVVAVCHRWKCIDAWLSRHSHNEDTQLFTPNGCMRSPVDIAAACVDICAYLILDTCMLRMHWTQTVVEGLRVAFLDGTQSRPGYNYLAADVDALSAQLDLLDGEVDVLLTCEWPKGIAGGAQARPPGCLDAAGAAATLPDGVTPRTGAPAVAAVAMKARPRCTTAATQPMQNQEDCTFCALEALPCQCTETLALYAWLNAL
eukprot:357773-Chlamydomonas_euryale.AAC.6